MFTYTRIITDEEEAILNHDLKDIVTWIDAAIDGKINNCSKRAAQQFNEVAKKEGIKKVPVDHKEAAAELFNSPGYKNRTQRGD